MPKRDDPDELIQRLAGIRARRQTGRIRDIEARLRAARTDQLRKETRRRRPRSAKGDQ